MALDNNFDDPDDRNAIVEWVQWGIWGLAGLCAIAFTWLKFDKSQFSQVLANTDPGFLLKIILIIYYFCWIGGATFDLKLQQTS